MKMYKKITSLLLSIIMLLSLAACGKEGGEVTTDLPETSAVEITAEETTAPLEEETTTLYDKLVAMEPLVLLRQGAKKTRNYRSFIKTTEITLDIPGVGKESREIVYTRNHDDYSEMSSIDGEMEGFVMYSGGVFSIYNSMLGKMGYSTKVETEEEYKKLEGDGPVQLNPLLFDFSGNENFADGIVSAGDEGFIVYIDLSKKGKEVLVGNNYGQQNWDYTVGKASIISWLDREGNIISVSFEAELNIKKLGKEEPVYVTAYSTLENVGEDITITHPQEIEFFSFSNFDKFYNFYAKASYNYTRIFNNGLNFSFANSIEITQTGSNYAKTIYDCTVRGRYKNDDSVMIAQEFEDRGNVISREEYKYYFDSGKVIQTTQTGEQVERNDISGEALYNYTISRCFRNFLLDYEQGIYSSSEKSSLFAIEDEQALELMKQYLTLCGFDAEKCEITIKQAQNKFEASSEYDQYTRIQIYINAYVKYDGSEFDIIVKDHLGQTLG